MMKCVVLVLAAAHAQINFLGPNDVAGVASTFQEGDGLPVDEFTISGQFIMDTRDRIVPFGNDWHGTVFYDNRLGQTDFMCGPSSLHTNWRVCYYAFPLGRVPGAMVRRVAQDRLREQHVRDTLPVEQ